MEGIRKWVIGHDGQNLDIESGDGSAPDRQSGLEEDEREGETKTGKWVQP